MLNTGSGGSVPSVVVSVSVPSWVSLGHDGNAACGHWGVASGLDTRPGGRSTRMFLTLPSGPSTVLLNVKLVTPVNGWAPACVSTVVPSALKTSALNWEIPKAALAGAAAVWTP